MMNPLVRDLYKRFLIAGRSYPTGLASIKEKIKAGFHEHAHVASELELKKAVASGRWWVREINAIGRIKKYRVMKKNYGKPEL